MKLFGVQGIMLAGLVGLGALGTVGCGSDSKGSGTGGTAGGTGGGGGAVVNHMINYTFTSSDESWIPNPYCGDKATDGNLGGKATPDAGPPTCLQPAVVPTAAFDSTDGSPSPGSLKVTVTYTGYKQYVDAIVNPPAGIDLTGRTLHAKVKLVSTMGGDFPGGLQFHVSSGASYAYGSAMGTLAAVGTWGDVTFPLSIVYAVTVPGWDSAMIKQIGIQFYSGDPPAGGGTLSEAAPISAVFAIDTVTD